MTAMSSQDLHPRFRSLMANLNQAFSAADATGFEAALGSLLKERESKVLGDVARLSESLLDALTRFRSDSRIVALAARDIPDARLRLDHVLQMTEDAAHKTLDLIERATPLADATARDAKILADTLDDRSHRDIRSFLGEVSSNAAQVRQNLTEVMLAQGFQDLTGQILNGVRTLIGEVETILDDLAGITGISRENVAQKDGLVLEGPAIPGVTRDAVTGQSDVDDLIAGLGI
jgi:chemotaxis protein CheZ